MDYRLDYRYKEGDAFKRAQELKKSVDSLINQRDQVDGIDDYRASGQKSTGNYKESIRLENGQLGEVELAKKVSTVGVAKAALASGVLFALNAFGLGATLMNVLLNPSTCLNSSSMKEGPILNFLTETGIKMRRLQQGEQQQHYTLTNRLEGKTVLREEVWLMGDEVVAYRSKKLEDPKGLPDDFVFQPRISLE